MENNDRDGEPEDGIVSEDLTQLVEHIELTGPQRLVDSPEWEMARPARDLGEAPLLSGDGTREFPAIEELGVAEDPERYTETEYDLGRRLDEERQGSEASAALAAERIRWQQRIEGLLMEIEERDQLLAERERRIEELSARLATATLERAGIERDLRETRDLAAAVAAEAAAPEPAPQDREPQPDPELETTSVMPMIEPRAEPRPRRYLIGVDQVGSVLEVTRRRVNIGRTHDNDLRIVDATVSRLHAVLTVRGGEAMVIDANSRNGVFVNGIQVRYAKLEDGDVVTFGTVRYRYRVGSGSFGDALGAA